MTGSEAKPQLYDRILIMRQPYLDLILDRQTLEVRPLKLPPGSFWLGMKGKLYAKITTGRPVHIANELDWVTRRHQHKVPGVKLPYKLKRKTWGIPILRVTPF